MGMTVQIPERLVSALERRAGEEGKEPQAIVDEILEKELNGEATAKPLTERAKGRALLRELGLTRPVSPELVKQYVKPRSDEEREAMLKRLQQISVSPPLSEMIIEDRGPR